jgi:hypothetical protein
VRLADLQNPTLATADIRAVPHPILDRALLSRQLA